VLALEHLISDARSIGIVMDDLFGAYTSILKSGSVQLDHVPLQFGDYALLQRMQHPRWFELHGAYWGGCRERYTRVRFPGNRDGSCRGWAGVRFSLDAELTQTLREWCRLHRITPALTVFSVFSAYVLQHCEVPEAMIRCQSDSRVHAQLARTVGYLSAPLYVRMSCSDSDTLTTLATRVVSSFREALHRADFGYLESQPDRTEFTRNAGFNWIPHAPKLELGTLCDTPWALEIEHVRFDHPLLDELDRDTEPFLEMVEHTEYVESMMHYPRARFSSQQMQEFCAEFERLLRRILSDPGRPLIAARV